MDVSTIIAIFLVVLLSTALVRWRKRITIQGAKLFGIPFLYVAMCRGTWGISSMNKISKKFPRLSHWFGIVSVIVGFGGMAFITWILLSNVVDLFIKPGTVPAVMPVLPISAAGVVPVPILYFLLCIPLVAMIHEFSHGVLARRYNIPVKSTGFAVVGAVIPIIPAAFVEPDEKVIEKKRPMQQLAVFAAGPMSNIVLAGLVLLLLFVVAPVTQAIFQNTGAEIVTVTNSSPAANAGLLPGDVITGVGNATIKTVLELNTALKDAKPDDVVTFVTNRSLVSFPLGSKPGKPSEGWMGVQLRQKEELSESFKNHSLIADFLMWILGFFYWLFLLSFGIGLFNLLPLGPIDGGRMLKTLLEHIHPKGTRVWQGVSAVFILIIVTNLVVGLVLPRL